MQKMISNDDWESKNHGRTTPPVSGEHSSYKLQLAPLHEKILIDRISLEKFKNET